MFNLKLGYLRQTGYSGVYMTMTVFDGNCLLPIAQNDLGELDGGPAQLGSGANHTFDKSFILDRWDDYSDAQKEFIDQYMLHEISVKVHDTLIGTHLTNGTLE